MADGESDEDAEKDPSTVNLQGEGEVDWLADTRDEADADGDDSES